MAVKSKIPSEPVPVQTGKHNPPPPPAKTGGGKVPITPKPPARRGDGPEPKGGGRSFMGPSYKKGGRVRKTAVALVHKGEHVVPAKGHRKATRHKRAARKA